MSSDKTSAQATIESQSQDVNLVTDENSDDFAPYRTNEGDEAAPPISVSSPRQPQPVAVTFAPQQTSTASTASAQAPESPQAAAPGVAAPASPAPESAPASAVSTGPETSPQQSSAPNAPAAVSTAPEQSPTAPQQVAAQQPVVTLPVQPIAAPPAQPTAESQSVARPPAEPLRQAAPSVVFERPSVQPVASNPNPHTPNELNGFTPVRRARPAAVGPALEDVALLGRAQRAPKGGWRKAVHTMSGGHMNPGDSPYELRLQELTERANRPIRGDYRIAVLSLKGGVGKTTTTVGLGSTFASIRGDRVIAIDANPDLGTLGQRVPQQSPSTVRDVLADTAIYRYSDIRTHTSQAPSRLEVLASERDPAVAEAFSEADYRGVMSVLQRFYNIIITDCGTGLSHSAMAGVLDLANCLILVSSPAIDGARSAGATLDWLEAHGYGELVSNAVVVLSSSRAGSTNIDVDQLVQHFLTRCRAVKAIPFDNHLAEGAEVDLELLHKDTRMALTDLAAAVADDIGFDGTRRPEPFFR